MNALPMETRFQTYKPTVRLLVLGVLLGRVQLFFQRKGMWHFSTVRGQP